VQALQNTWHINYTKVKSMLSVHGKTTNIHCIVDSKHMQVNCNAFKIYSVDRNVCNLTIQRNSLLHLHGKNGYVTLLQC